MTHQRRGGAGEKKKFKTKLEDPRTRERNVFIVFGIWLPVPGSQFLVPMPDSSSVFPLLQFSSSQFPVYQYQLENPLAAYPGYLGSTCQCNSRINFEFRHFIMVSQSKTEKVPKIDPKVSAEGRNRAQNDTPGGPKAPQSASRKCTGAPRRS